ncbi:quaternary amine ABC transporter ATP-binding protein [Symbioplanes lichenis]|uniref:quaternary amine ABC transporter ATP-binding protein n=1 Tax=Symbioplanes lichenis TaxID=1629072 RepID=UPI003F691355
MISVDHLWKVFGPRPERIPGSELAALPRAELHARTGCVAAVRDVSFEVAAGEVFVVMGLSGSGKSTLVRCLTRLIEPTAGDIAIGGDPVRALSPRRLRELRRHRVAMVFQHFGLLPHRRVLDNVAYGLEIQGTGRADRHRRAAEVLDLVGLAGHEQRYPDELSGGMQQRVGLARALAGDPEVLLFDEPFSALDPLIRRDMQAEVRRLHAEVGKTMLFITHDLAEALTLGDRIAVLRDGALVQVGTPEQLVGSPADDYVRDFVRDVPRADVLTLRWIARPADPAHTPARPSPPAHTPARPSPPAPPARETRARPRQHEAFETNAHAHPTANEQAHGSSDERTRITTAGDPLPATMLIRDAVPRILRAAGPVPIADGDHVIGVVGVEELLPVLAGRSAPPQAQPPAATDRVPA